MVIFLFAQRSQSDSGLVIQEKLVAAAWIKKAPSLEGVAVKRMMRDFKQGVAVPSPQPTSKAVVG